MLFGLPSAVTMVLSPDDVCNPACAFGLPFLSGSVKLGLPFRNCKLKFGLAFRSGGGTVIVPGVATTVAAVVSNVGSASSAIGSKAGRFGSCGGALGIDGLAELAVRDEELMVLPMLGLALALVVPDWMILGESCVISWTITEARPMATGVVGVGGG